MARKRGETPKTKPPTEPSPKKDPQEQPPKETDPELHQVRGCATRLLEQEEIAACGHLRHGLYFATIPQGNGKASHVAPEQARRVPRPNGQRPTQHVCNLRRCGLPPPHPPGGGVDRPWCVRLLRKHWTSPARAGAAQARAPTRSSVTSSDSRSPAVLQRTEGEPSIGAWMLAIGRRFWRTTLPPHQMEDVVVGLPRRDDPGELLAKGLRLQLRAWAIAPHVEPRLASHRELDVKLTRYKPSMSRNSLRFSSTSAAMSRCGPEIRATNARPDGGPATRTESGGGMRSDSMLS